MCWTFNTRKRGIWRHYGATEDAQKIPVRKWSICAKWRSAEEGMALKKAVNCSDRKSRKPLGDYMLKLGDVRGKGTFREWNLCFVGNNYIRYKQYGRVDNVNC